MQTKYIHYIKSRNMEGGKKNNGVDPKFSLHVSEPWLFYIQTGKKKVEGRKGSKEKFAHWIGKKVHFYNNDRKIPVKVKEIRHYDDLYKYLDVEGAWNVTPGLNHQQSIDAYHKYYSDDAIKEAGGMLAIEIELI